MITLLMILCEIIWRAATTSFGAPWLGNYGEYLFYPYEIFIFYRAYDYELPKIRAFVGFYSEKS